VLTIVVITIMMLNVTPSSKPAVLIVGAGVFGLSTAYHLLERGYTEVTVLDRAERLPAIDAASTDMNKGISFSQWPYDIALLTFSKWSVLVTATWNIRNLHARPFKNGARTCGKTVTMSLYSGFSPRIADNYCSIP
jgi:phytoene dehydrogenase-like protein